MLILSPSCRAARLEVWWTYRNSGPKTLDSLASVEFKRQKLLFVCSIEVPCMLALSEEVVSRKSRRDNHWWLINSTFQILKQTLAPIFASRMRDTGENILKRQHLDLKHILREKLEWKSVLCWCSRFTLQTINQGAMLSIFGPSVITPKAVCLTPTLAHRSLNNLFSISGNHLKFD